MLPALPKIMPHALRHDPVNQAEIPDTHRRNEPDWTSLRWVVGVLAVGAFVAMVPLWAPVLLAAWAAVIARPAYQVLAKRIHRRKGAAAMVTVLLVVALLAPVVVATLSLSGSAIELGQRLLESKSGTDAWKALGVRGDDNALDFTKLNMQQAFELARRHGTSAMGAAKTLFGAATVLVLGVVVFVSGFYTFLANGSKTYEWFLERSPLSRGHSHRLASVFAEVGKGLLIGVGLTALIQGVVATIGYFVTGVPQPLVLGLITVFASLIPSIGSGLVWVPVTVGLAVSGRSGAAVVMLVIGCVVSVVDNVMRPMLSRYGELRLNGLVLFIAMLGGIAVLGGGGLLLGPLFVRLAAEGLTMLHEHREEQAAQG